MAISGGWVLDRGNAAVVGERWLSIRANLALGPVRLFERDDPPPPQETTNPKRMAQTAVQVADSIKCYFAVSDIISPIPQT